ncbi:hypothetical protein F5Y05DRAFT_380811 [Hypoxylon sp. FL0543]|nr:hypothetical protein F5Y05DRAFT_380811 [Hypoxylon sp. FL0543]
MSSVTTTIPTSPISEWCLVPASPRRQLFTPDCPEPYRNNTTVKPEFFQSICCDGVIVDTSLDLYNSSPSLPYSIPDAGNNTHPVNLSDLVCCGIAGLQSEALNPTPSPKFRTVCAPGTTSTPLASLAATNASGADLYAVTYASRSATDDSSATVTNDLWGWATPTYGASGTPVCLWVNTESGVSMAEVTVPATYVAPAASSTGSGSATMSSSSSDGGLVVRMHGGSRTRLCAALGLVAIGLLLA